MKGIELPINILIIVAVAVIVLIALIAMFYPAFSGGSNVVSLDIAKAQACRSLAEGNKCSTSVNLVDIYVYGFDADKDGSNDPGNGAFPIPLPNPPCPTASANDNLLVLCVCHFNIGSPDCRKMCGC